MIINQLLAEIPLYPDGGFSGWGKIGLENTSPTEAPSIFNRFISTVIGVLTIIAGLWFIFVFISGAISMISSGGDKGALESARKKIFGALVGLAVVIASIFLIDLVGKILGVNLILNPADFIKSVWQ